MGRLIDFARAVQRRRDAEDAELCLVCDLEGDAADLVRTSADAVVMLMEDGPGYRLTPEQAVALAEALEIAAAKVTTQAQGLSWELKDESDDEAGEADGGGD